jgi:hypothetical protein
MAEINERASTSSDPPPTPAPFTGTISPELNALANDAFHRVGTFLQGQIESEMNFSCFFSQSTFLLFISHLHLHRFDQRI